MATLKDLLARYNLIATRAGASTIKEWKGSKDQLQKKIDALTADNITITHIAREVGMEPKAARGRLRRKGIHKAGDPWPLYKRGGNDHREIVEALTADDASAAEGDRSDS